MSIISYPLIVKLPTGSAPFCTVTDITNTVVVARTNTIIAEIDFGSGWYQVVIPRDPAWGFIRLKIDNNSGPLWYQWITDSPVRNIQFNDSIVDIGD